jgi:iron complex transport system ATP-binding protein
MVGIVGPNGSGKSTLLKLIGGIIPCAPHCIRFLGAPLEHYSTRQLAQSIAMVFQSLRYGLENTIWQHVLSGRYAHRGSYLFDRAEDLDLSRWAMGVTKISHLRNKLLKEVSQGEQQRVALAAALVQKPTLLLLDEPTSALDIKYQLEIMHILSKLIQTQQMTILMALHDLNLASRFCDRIILLKQGQIQAEGTPQEVLTKPLLENTFETKIEVRYDVWDGYPYIILDPTFIKVRGGI